MIRRWWWVFLLAFLLGVAVALFSPVGAQGTLWFVSRSGNNANGQDWPTAWNELNQIRWDLVQPGDTIIVDGGALACPSLGDEVPLCGMVYNTQLAFGKDGVTIRLAADVGRNGTAIFDGNQTNFTYCSENSPMPAPPSAPKGSILGTVVTFNGRSNAVLDGTKWGGIVVRNGVTYGINLGGGDGNTVRHVKVHHINNPNDTSNNSVGIVHGWTAQGVILERVEIYRIGQDAIRVAGDDFTLRDSYIHDLYCNHPDGIQALVYTNNSDIPDNEGKIENLSVIGNVFERVGLQAVFLGENSGHNSWVDGAAIRDNLFLDMRYGLKTKHTNSTNFVVERNTFIGSSEFAVEWCCANPGARAPMRIADNIFEKTINPAGTGFFIPNTVFTDNCLWQSGGVAGPGVVVSGTINQDPETGCAGKGSELESALDLLETETPTPTPIATETPTLSEPTISPTVATPTPDCIRMTDGLLCFIPYTPTP